MHALGCPANSPGGACYCQAGDDQRSNNRAIGESTRSSTDRRLDRVIELLEQLCARFTD